MKKLHARELSRNQPILRFDVILQHDWPIEQCLLHIRVFFGGKTKSPCVDLFIHWLIKQITNTHLKRHWILTTSKWSSFRRLLGLGGNVDWSVEWESMLSFSFILGFHFILGGLVMYDNKLF